MSNKTFYCHNKFYSVVSLCLRNCQSPFTGFNKHTSFLIYRLITAVKGFMIQAPGVLLLQNVCQMGLYHPLDGVTNPKYKLLRFLTTIFFHKQNEALAFNRDRCCHLVLCLQLILFHCHEHHKFMAVN
jgi:hypothetical protein